MPAPGKQLPSGGCLPMYANSPEPSLEGGISSAATLWVRLSGAAAVIRWLSFEARRRPAMARAFAGVFGIDAWLLA